MNTSFQWLLLLAAPIVGIIYAILEYFGILDRLSGRESALQGLNRLRSASGYPVTWIFDDEKDKSIFRALYVRISKKTKQDKIKKVLHDGHKPSQIVTAGSPIPINALPPEWKQEEKYFYSENHPVLFVFGIERKGGQGKADKVCTLKELDDWIREEKENRKFYVGTLMIGLLSIAVIMVRLLIN